MKTKSTRTALDEAISEINFENIAEYRKIKNVNSHYGYLHELQAIEMIFGHLMQMIRTGKSTSFLVASNMWELKYERKKKRYRKNEKYNLYLSFVLEAGAYEDYC